MKTFWTIEEWIPVENTVWDNGYWYLLPDSRIDEHDKVLSVFERLKKEGREVRLIENTRTVVNT